jgi:ABC-type glycerol-3-phosphate transport system substrate-binding protein
MLALRMSRRSIMHLAVASAGTAILAACGAAPSPTAAPQKPAEAPKPAAAEPTKPAAAPAATTAPAAAAPTTAPAAAPTTAAAPAKPTEAPKPAAAAPAPAATAAGPTSATSGKFNVWFSANWNKVTDEAVGQAFVDWGKQNNVPVEWTSIPGSPQQLQMESAALAAGLPPELNRSNQIYWYTLGEMTDLTELVNKMKDKAGGMYPIGISSSTAPDKKIFGAPWAIDTWPVHYRKDVIEPVTGGRFFNSYDELLELGPKIQQPPRTYAYGMSLGHEGDHVNNVMSVLWNYGGRLANEEGVPDIKNPANKAGIDMIVKLVKAKLVPPDTFAQTVTSWNNETYQKGRGMIVINPCTVYGWLLVNDKELADKTGLTNTPKGPAGSFTEAGALSFSVFKKAKMADKANSALEYFLQPAVLEKISKAVEGRFVPIYRDHTKTDFWQKSGFAALKDITENGRIREWPAPPAAWLPDVTDARYTLSDMVQKILNDNMPVEKAQEWAQAEMMDSYTKLMKK